MLELKPSAINQAWQPLPPNIHLRDRVSPYGPKSRFLELPSEIRNQIYTYIFTLTDGVRVSSNLKLCLVNPQPGATESGRTTLVEANALKYTCHQLHFETKVLLLKYTTSFIFKPSPGDEDALKAFLAFTPALKSETPIRRTIHMYLDHHYPASDPYRCPLGALVGLIVTGDFNDLAFFCQQNPSLTVLLHYPVPLLCLMGLRPVLLRLRSTVHILRNCPMATALGSLGWQVPRTRMRMPLNVRVMLDWEFGEGGACVSCGNPGVPWSEFQGAAENAALVEWYKDGV
ncbi:hypothetical protein PTT_19967 [Pyrenophora teres f. teres 0-1]|uniref:Uncharacterized protein n=2 Tax=Pyrenophora teres f. teres TaxID=97479 RepID=E3SA51_PYRTT|nr:hypothetical protein PTT_19967 [Pyrenophora teres f. teres 0-1]KAE8837732.1 hypothetical protein PTNB85_05067 [Pyrenophora teres f. teres]CAE6997167.1 hypothetical protein PTTW11_00480 [Pyrenophora teres f. teres]